jgi:hypothetical protein
VVHFQDKWESNEVSILIKLIMLANVNAVARLSQDQARDWNAKYQKILNTHVQGEEMVLKRDILMIEVVGMFQDYSTSQAKSIIDNLHLNSSHGDGSKS